MFIRGTRIRLVLLGVLLVCIAGIVAAIAARGSASAPQGPPATPTIPAWMIMKPAYLPVAGMLSDGSRLAGTIYPGYPGANTLRLHLNHQPSSGSAATLVASMRGMAMTPLHAVLNAKGRNYSGKITLPMFGIYNAQVTLASATQPVTGTIVLTLSLPHP